MGGGGGHNRGDRGDRRQPRGGGGSWERGAAPPQQRRDSQPNNQNTNDGGGGGQWARGKAPPPQQQHQGGRGGGRGGRGGGRGGQQQPFFDGPVVPLTESKNGWRPKKNTGPLVIAEKKIKSILNKMTKEKFDRLSQQIIDIPVTSYQILTLMISKVYEKGIDEPYLGDMYGDLCVRMSLHVQSNSFVQIIESNEKPQRILQSKPNTGNTDSKPGHPPLDKDKFERRIKTIRNEYIQDPKNLKELMLSMDELTGTKNYGSQLVSLNADHMIDCKEAERNAIFLLLEVLVKEDKISSNDVKIGLADTIEFIDSLVCDAPMAYDYLGRMLATMIRSNAIDVTWIGQQAEKTKISNDATPEKIIRAIIKAIHSDKGVEAVKNSFGHHQAAMETLLGKDKWVVIKAEI